MNTAVSKSTQKRLAVQQVVDATPLQAVAKAPDQSPALSAVAMIERALQSGIGMDQLDRLLDLHDRMSRVVAEQQFNAAFSKFKEEPIEILKTAKVAARGTSYAPLSEILKTVTPVLSKHGLSANWEISGKDPNWIEVTCTLRHVGGHSQAATFGGPPDDSGKKNPVQARASTVSYLCRYTLKAVLGVAEAEDDKDGDGGANVDDMADKLFETVMALLENAVTPEECNSIWRDHNPSLIQWPELHDKFKAAAIAKRNELREQQEQKEPGETDGR